MGWEAFWLPNLIQWGGSAVVGGVISLLLRRGVQQLKGEQERTSGLVVAAGKKADAAGEKADAAAGAAQAAAAQGAETKTTVEETHAALSDVTAPLLLAYGQIERMAHGNDDLLAAHMATLADYRKLTSYLVREVRRIQVHLADQETQQATKAAAGPDETDPS